MIFNWDEYREKYLVLYSDCIAVQGSAKSAIYDLTRHEIISFSSVYFEVVDAVNRKRVSVILDELGQQFGHDQVMTVIDFLRERELTMLVDDPSDFPLMQDMWDHPGVLQNAIIDVADRVHDFSKLFVELSDLGCQHIQIRCFTALISLPGIEAILNMVKDTAISSVEVLIKYDKNLQESDYLTLIRLNPLLVTLTVHTAPYVKKLVVHSSPSAQYNAAPSLEVDFTTQSITSERGCGLISPRQFTPPTPNSFFEAKGFNGCLNRKIAVGSDGYIKNCPSMRTSFGHIDTLALADAVHRPDLQENWRLPKSHVEICKTCEYRYACSDCRAYLDDPSNPLSKPLKCGYDPSTGIWSEWTKDPKKLDAARLYQIER